MNSSINTPAFPYDGFSLFAFFFTLDFERCVLTEILILQKTNLFLFVLVITKKDHAKAH